MKKYLKTLIMALIIGFFLSNFFINQYKDYNGIKTVGLSTNLYFIQYGVYSSKELMEQNTIQLENYVYNLKDGMFYVYVGITKNKDNANKIINYYKELGYDTILKEFYINNKDFLELIDNYDNILNSTNDKVTESSIINQILIKYEEVVLSGSQN